MLDYRRLHGVLQGVAGVAGVDPWEPTPPTVLLEDNFTTPVAATLPGSRNCEPTGTLTISTPGASKIDAGLFDTTPTAANTVTVYDSTIRADLPGLAAAFKGGGATGSGVTHSFGWDENASGSPTVGLRKGITIPPQTITGVETFLDTEDMSTANDKWLVSVRLGGGWYANFARSGSGSWYLVDITKRTADVSMHAGFRDPATSGGIQLDRMIVAQMFDKFTTLFKWSELNEISPVGEVVLPDSANFYCMVDLSVNPSGEDRVIVKYRVQDEDNYWAWELTGAGSEFANSSFAVRVENGVEVLRSSVSRANATGAFVMTAYGAEINFVDCQSQTVLNSLLNTTFETETEHSVIIPASAEVARIVAGRAPMIGNVVATLDRLIA